MAPVVCQLCGGKKFKDEEAYAQHARDNKAHRLKEKLQRPQAKASQSQSAPLVPTMKPGYCKLCKIDFLTASALREHIKSGESRYHPKCLRCGEAFENHDELETVSVLTRQD